MVVHVLNKGGINESLSFFVEGLLEVVGGLIIVLRRQRDPHCCDKMMAQRRFGRRGRNRVLF